MDILRTKVLQFRDELAKHDLKQQDKALYLEYWREQSIIKLDYYYLFARLNGLLVILFHLTLFFINRNPEDFLYVVCMAISFAALANID